MAGHKVFTLKVGDRDFKLCFNIIFGEQLAKVLKCEATPNGLMAGLLALNQKSSFLMSKAIVHCGILAHDYMVGYEESVTGEEVGELIVGSSESQLREMFNTVAEELGFKLKADVPEEPKKKTKKSQPTRTSKK